MSPRNSRIAKNAFAGARYNHHNIAYDDWARRLVQEYDHAFRQNGLDPSDYDLTIDLEDGGRYAKVTSRGHRLWPRVRFDAMRMREDGSGVTAREMRIVMLFKVMESRMAGLAASKEADLPLWSFRSHSVLAELFSTYDIDAAGIASSRSLADPADASCLWSLTLPGDDAPVLKMERGPTHVSLEELRLAGLTMTCRDKAKSNGEYQIVMDQDLPQTVCTAAIGMPLSEVIGHRAFSGMTGITVSSATKVGETTVICFNDAMVNLTEVPDHVDVLDPLLRWIDPREVP